jgi:hypothetical protein
MSTLSAASLRHKPNITGRSTGSCPGDWRRFWATESERAGSNWRHLLDAAPTWKEAAEQYHRDRAGRPLIVEIEPERLKRLRDLLKDGPRSRRSITRSIAAATARQHRRSKRSCLRCEEAVLL